METVRIDALDDPRVADFRNLRDATLVRERGRFIVEGRGNLLVLVEESSIRPESILLSERSERALHDRLAARDVGCPVYVASQPVVDAIAGLSIHRGVLACCLRPAPLDPLELARRLLATRPAPRLVVLEGLTNHDNVGGVFRNAMALGGDAVLLCPRTCDPLYRKAIRTSMGGTLRVPFARADDLARLLGALSALGFAILALDPAETAEDLGRLDPATVGPAAILLGTEGPGLSASALARADRRVRIAMEPGVDSLNVSVASAIALHRLRVD